MDAARRAQEEQRRRMETSKTTTRQRRRRGNVRLKGTRISGGDESRSLENSVVIRIYLIFDLTVMRTF